MTRRIQAVIAALVCFAIVGVASVSGVHAKKPSVEGGSLPFELPDMDGNVVNSGDERFAGKVVLVDLWGTWCPPCVTEIPTFIELQEKYADDGLVIVAIAFETDESAEARQTKLRDFAEGKDINYLVLDGGRPQDFSTALPTVRDIGGLPVEVFIDRSGKVTKVKKSFGYKRSWVRKLTRDLEALLAESAD